MKRMKQVLAGILCAAVLAGAAPAAFAERVIITFDANGGKSSSVVEVTDSEGHLAKMPSVSMEGYDFTGWYVTGIDESLGVPTDVLVDGDTVFSKDTTVYARWIANDSSPEAEAAPSETTAADRLIVLGMTVSSVLLVLTAGMMWPL